MLAGRQIQPMRQHECGDLLLHLTHLTHGVKHHDNSDHLQAAALEADNVDILGLGRIDTQSCALVSAGMLLQQTREFARASMCSVAGEVLVRAVYFLADCRRGMIRRLGAGGRLGWREPAWPSG